jgi:hypothetical protein
VSPAKYELGFYISEDDILHISRSMKSGTHISLLSSGDVRVRCSSCPPLYTPPAIGDDNRGGVCCVAPSRPTFRADPLLVVQQFLIYFTKWSQIRGSLS